MRKELIARVRALVEEFGEVSRLAAFITGNDPLLAARMVLRLADDADRMRVRALMGVGPATGIIPPTDVIVFYAPKLRGWIVREMEDGVVRGDFLWPVGEPTFEELQDKYGVATAIHVGYGVIPLVTLNGIERRKAKRRKGYAEGAGRG